jgi:hypothetical protein
MDMESIKKNTPKLLLIFILLAAGVIACGSGGGGGGSNELTIVSSTPEDGATGVRVTTSQVQITFSKSIDDTFQDAMIVGTLGMGPGSESYVLGYNLMRYVSYDDSSRTMTIDLKGLRDLQFVMAGEIQAGYFGRCLEWDAKYRIVLSGIRDLAGEEMPLSDIFFKTFRNPEYRGIEYSAPGVVANYREYVYDSENNLSRRVYYSGAGPDSIWFNDDDIFSGYTGYTYNSDNELTYRIFHNGAGADGDWFTADDDLTDQLVLPAFFLVDDPRR